MGPPGLPPSNPSRNTVANKVTTYGSVYRRLRAGQGSFLLLNNNNDPYRAREWMVTLPIFVSLLEYNPFAAPVPPRYPSSATHNYVE